MKPVRKLWRGGGRQGKYGSIDGYLLAVSIKPPTRKVEKVSQAIFPHLRLYVHGQCKPVRDQHRVESEGCKKGARSDARRAER